MFYCASMLMLLKPWHSLHDDLKSPSESWETAFEHFLAGTPHKIKTILSGIQYFHDSESTAKD
jgi:hypothetical protein